MQSDGTCADPWRRVLRHNLIRFAAAIILAVGGLSNASAAGIYFTADGTGTLSYFNWNIPYGIFGFFYDYLDVTPTCPAGSCVAASTPDGTPLGDFGLGIGGNYFLSNVGDGMPATLVGTSLYYELLAPFPAGGSGSIAMTSPTLSPYLLEGTVTGLGIYTTVGTTNATIEVDISNATSQVIAGLPSAVYLDISGTTNDATSITEFSGNPPANVINPFILDWTATLSDTSFMDMPESSSSAPEPSVALLLAGGFLSLVAVRIRGLRRRRARPIDAQVVNAFPGS